MAILFKNVYDTSKTVIFKKTVKNTSKYGTVKTLIKLNSIFVYVFIVLGDNKEDTNARTYTTRTYTTM